MTQKQKRPLDLRRHTKALLCAADRQSRAVSHHGVLGQASEDPVSPVGHDDGGRVGPGLQQLLALRPLGAAELELFALLRTRATVMAFLNRVSLLPLCLCAPI